MRARPVPGPWLPPPIGPRYVDTTPAEVTWRAGCDRCGTDAAWRKGRDAARHLHVHLPARGGCSVTCPNCGQEIRRRPPTIAEVIGPEATRKLIEQERAAGARIAARRARMRASKRARGQRKEGAA